VQCGRNNLLVKAEGRGHKAEGRRLKLRKSRVSIIKNVVIALAVAIKSLSHPLMPS
jgi:hypothetical protein